MKISTVMNIKNKKDRYYSENTKTDEAKYRFLEIETPLSVCNPQLFTKFNS